MPHQSQEKLLKTLQYFKKNETIYPGLIAKRGSLTLHDAYRILKDIEKLKYIEHVFLINCPSCGEEHFYESIGNIHGEFECSHCGYADNLNIFSDVLIVYRVVCE